MNKCKTCLYHSYMNTSEVCCMYIVATGQRRLSSVKNCDKYKCVTEKERKAFWKKINNVDNDPLKPNARTLNRKKCLERIEEEKRHEQ